MQGSKSERPPPSAGDGELHQRLPELIVPAALPSQGAPSAHITAFEPVLYESDPLPLEEQPKIIPAAGYDSSLSTPGITGHVVEFTDDSTPETEPRVTP